MCTSQDPCSVDKHLIGVQFYRIANVAGGFCYGPIFILPFPSDASASVVPTRSGQARRNGMSMNTTSVGMCHQAGSGEP